MSTLRTLNSLYCSIHCDSRRECDYINHRTIDSSICKEHKHLRSSVCFVTLQKTFFPLCRLVPRSTSSDRRSDTFCCVILYVCTCSVCVSVFLLSFSSGHYLPFCIIWALENPDNSTKPSEQYTIGYPDT